MIVADHTELCVKKLYRHSTCIQITYGNLPRANICEYNSIFLMSIVYTIIAEYNGCVIKCVNNEDWKNILANSFL